MPNPLPIVTGSDDNYALGVAGLLASLGRTNTGVDLTILSLGITPENQSRLLALGRAYGVKTTVIDIDRSLVERLQVKRKHITSATFLRLLIPSLFPDAGNLLYLDCDMTVAGPLDALCRIDLGNDLIGAVKDPQPHDAPAGSPPSDEINAGMLLMNIPAWISEKVAETCLDLLSDPASGFAFEDQSAINRVCAGRIRFLPQIWNTHTTYNVQQDYLFTDPAEARILHFVGDIKPWNAKTNFSALWRAPFAGVDLPLPPCGPVAFNRRLSRLNLMRRELSARLSGKASARQKQRFDRAVKTQIVPILSERLRKPLPKT
jgi:lipopolysaccharide biosynthesis glycosyltransferase